MVRLMVSVIYAQVTFWQLPSWMHFTTVIKGLHLFSLVPFELTCSVTTVIISLSQPNSTSNWIMNSIIGTDPLLRHKVPGMSCSVSAITRGLSIMLLPSTTSTIDTYLCVNLLVGILARDWCEGIEPFGQCSDRSHRSAIVCNIFE